MLGELIELVARIWQADSEIRDRSVLGERQALAKATLRPGAGGYNCCAPAGGQGPARNEGIYS